MTAPRRPSNLRHNDFTLDPTLAFGSPLLAELLAYWRGKCGDRAMPPRAAIDPSELLDHIGWIILTDVLESPPRFRYRLIGTEITRLVGRDMTGRFLDEVYVPAIHEIAVSGFRWIIEHRRPLRITGTLDHAQNKQIMMESIDLPLSSDGETVTMILTRTLYSREARPKSTKPAI
jgi:hypothetical protein